MSTISYFHKLFAAGMIGTMAFLPFAESLPAQAQWGNDVQYCSQNFRDARNFQQRLEKQYRMLKDFWEPKVVGQNIYGSSEPEICFDYDPASSLPAEYNPGQNIIYVNMPEMYNLLSRQRGDVVDFLLVRAYADSILSEKNLPFIQSFKERELKIDEITAAFLRKLAWDREDIYNVLQYLHDGSYHLDLTNNSTYKERIEVLYRGYHNLDLLFQLSDNPERLPNLDPTYLGTYPPNTRARTQIPECVNANPSNQQGMYKVRVIPHDPSSFDRLLNYIDKDMRHDNYPRKSLGWIQVIAVNNRDGAVETYRKFMQNPEITSKATVSCFFIPLS